MNKQIINKKNKIKVGDCSRGRPEGSLFNRYYIKVLGRALLLPPDYFTILDTYLIMLIVKEWGIKYHFLSFWYDVTWDWTLVSRTIGENRIIHDWKKLEKSFNCVKKMSSDSFKNVIYSICFSIIYLIYIYEKDLAWNNLQWLICHKTKLN